MADCIVDSCCVINLYAAGTLLNVLPTMLGLLLHIPEKALQESLYVRAPDPADATRLMQRAVDLAPLIAAGVLHRCDLEGADELNLFVQLATTLDDGEAACLASAKLRGWTLATDDRKGRREAGNLGVAVVTTAELVKAWADVTKADDAAVAEVLRDIQDYARFTPHRTMPLRSWWVDTIGKGGA
jgi:predicted nucleic acid-binding protein